jgi:hypothetical protein
MPLPRVLRPLRAWLKKGPLAAGQAAKDEGSAPAAPFRRQGGRLGWSRLGLRCALLVTELKRVVVPHPVRPAVLKTIRCQGGRSATCTGPKPSAPLTPDGSAFGWSYGREGVPAPFPSW